MRANIQIYNEDCLPAMQKMADNEFDIAIVDPPYGINKITGKEVSHTRGKLRHRTFNQGSEKFNKWDIPNVIQSNICLLPMVTDKSWSYLSLYRHYKNNILPFSGGILDQPYKYRAAMELISSQ